MMNTGVHNCNHCFMLSPRTALLGALTQRAGHGSSDRCFLCEARGAIDVAVERARCAVVQKVDLQLKLPPRSPLMVQPPADHSIGAAALLHYTWGSIFKDTHANNAEVWKFDKRFYTDKAVALKVRFRNPLPPTPILADVTRLCRRNRPL